MRSMPLCFYAKNLNEADCVLEAQKQVRQLTLFRVSAYDGEVNGPQTSDKRHGPTGLQASAIAVMATAQPVKNLPCGLEILLDGWGTRIRT
jgi:hypothetical protein